MSMKSWQFYRHVKAVVVNDKNGNLKTILQGSKNGQKWVQCGRKGAGLVERLQER